MLNEMAPKLTQICAGTWHWIIICFFFSYIIAFFWGRRNDAFLHRRRRLELQLLIKYSIDFSERSKCSVVSTRLLGAAADAPKLRFESINSITAAWLWFKVESLIRTRRIQGLNWSFFSMVFIEACLCPPVNFSFAFMCSAPGKLPMTSSSTAPL